MSDTCWKVLSGDVRSIVAPPSSWWWCSFCDADKPEGERFVGVAIVYSQEPLVAFNAHVHDCNPGGDLFYVQCPNEWGPPPAEWRNRLLTDKSRINELSIEWTGGEIMRVSDLEN